MDADDALLPGLWAALDALTTDADMILFGLTRESGGAVKPTDYLPAGFCPDLQALGSALSPCCLTRGCWPRPTPSCSAARPSGRCGLMRALPSTRTCCLTYNFYRIPLPFIVWMVYTISSMIPRSAVCPAACGGLAGRRARDPPGAGRFAAAKRHRPGPYEAASRLRACLNQYGLLTGCKGTLSYAERRALFAEILADPAARKALRERLRNDPNRLLAVPYRIGMACNWPGLLAGYTMAKQRLL
ncbi:hypothetical protein NIA69_07985 [Gemmiger formicilis]|nr:hypothetical protein [Gemmiger formicilis]